MNDITSRGSEWGKWDLHVHSPASFFWKGGKKLHEMDDYEKTASVKKFIDTVNGSDVDVFAVQDYWTFDWIIEIRKYLTSNPDALKKTVLTGMELRIECSSDFRLNIHVLLSDKLSNQQLSDFKSKLQIRIGVNERALSNEALIEFARILDKSKAKHHGYSDPGSLAEDKLLELGSMTAEVTRDSLLKAISSVPKNTCFILLPYDTSDGLAKLDWANHPQDDIFYMQSAHIFESRDQKNIDLINGRKTNDNQHFYDNFFKTLGNKPKPCTSGSDAHKFDDYGIYPSNKATWIKSKPTFKGLEQIVYETDRVLIQELRPEEKSAQAIIDRVEYTSKSGEIRKVYFNQNLNSLIGSRAQGKSNLLRNIAYSIDPEQCSVRGVTTRDFLPLKDFKIIWADGVMNTLDDLLEEKEKGVLFIPQRYLGELVYDKNPKFDNFLIGLFENSTSFKSGQDTYKKFEESNSLEIVSLLQVLLDTRTQGLERADKIKKLGSKEGFDKEIIEIESRIKTYGKSAQISEKELKNYDRVSSNIKNIEDRIKVITQDIESLKQLRGLDVITTNNVEEYDFSDVTFQKIATELSKSDKDFKDTFIKMEVKTLSEELKKLSTKINNLANEIKPFEDRIKKSQALVTLTKVLNEKKAAKINVTLLEKEKDELVKSYQVTIQSLQDKFISYETEYNLLKIEVGSKLEFSEVKIVVSFDAESFRRFIDDNINYHNSVDYKKTDSKAKKLLDDPVLWQYDPRNFKEILKDLISGILSGKLIIKSGKNQYSVLSELLRNRYKIDFLQSVKKNGVPFTDMSDGEQMLALLEFIFKFDGYNYPVLLDQPEDDLDAKAISSTIVEFIKSEKVARQIIIASHNANLVVCGDSENVIVSRKFGGNNPDFKYMSGAIEEDDLNKEILEILEGGEKAFAIRKSKLGIS